MNSPRQTQHVLLEHITVSDRLRHAPDEAVERLAASIGSIGLRTPITIRAAGEHLLLVTGYTRLRAAAELGWREIEAFVVDDCDEIDAQLWEIAENLHRAELTALERDEQVALWVRLNAEKVSAQVAPKSGAGRPEGGTRAAARELGIDRDDARRAVKVASLSPAAKEAARAAGLDDNRTALLNAARETGAEAQVAAIHSKRDAAVKDAADRAEARAEAKRKRDEEQAEHDRQREAIRAGLPQAIRDREDAREAAKGSRAVVEDGLSPEDRIAELEEANRCLEAEAERLRAENKLYGEMRAEWESGGFAKVIDGKDEVIRVQARRIEQESADKASWARTAKSWKKRAIEAGWSSVEEIEIPDQDVANA